MREKNATALVLTVLYGLLILALLVLVLTGARLYGGITQESTRQGEIRTALSFLQGQAAADRTGVTLTPGPEGQMLRIADGEYETRIYQYQGTLMCEYAKADGGVNPETGESICGISSLELALQGNLLTVWVDGARGEIWLAGGGGHGEK